MNTHSYASLSPLLLQFSVQTTVLVTLHLLTVPDLSLEQALRKAAKESRGPGEC